MRKALLTLYFVLSLAVATGGQIAIPHTFTAGTVIDPDQMNANFTAVSAALLRTGGTMTGVLKVTAGTCAAPGIGNTSQPTTGVVLGGSGTIGFCLAGTERMLLDSNGLTVYGVNILNSSGKIPAISSTYFTSLSAANLTSVPAGQLTGDIPAGVTKESSAINIAGRQTLWVPASAMSVTVTAGASALATTETTAGRPDMHTMSFGDTSDQFAQFDIAWPKSWNEGTITFQPYWTGSAAGAGTTIWGLQCVSIADDATMDVAYGTAQTSTDTFLAVEDVHVGPESSAITIASAAVDTLTSCQVYRDADADSRAAASLLLGLKIYFTTDAKNDS